MPSTAYYEDKSRVMKLPSPPAGATSRFPEQESEQIQFKLEMQKLQTWGGGDYRANGSLKGIVAFLLNGGQNCQKQKCLDRKKVGEPPLGW